MAYRLTKSRLLSFRQCPKRLWLEVHRPDLAEVSAEAEQAFEQGDELLPWPVGSTAKAP